MIILYILGLLLGIIMFIISGLALSNERYLTAFISFVLATITCTTSTIQIINNSPDTRTVKCSEIKQIDTIYKNDSIIGYELILEK